MKFLSRKELHEIELFDPRLAKPQLHDILMPLPGNKDAAACFHH